MNKPIAFTLFVLGTFVVLLGVVQGAAYYKETAAAFDGGAPCTKLAGVPGMLQTVGLLPSGTCQTKDDGTCKNAGSACTVSEGNPSPGGKGDKKAGTCRQLNKNCQCMPN